MRNDGKRRETGPISFAFRAMTLEDARAIAAWRYESPYDFYDGNNAEQIEGVPPGFDAATSDGELVGFVCFGVEARVPGCEHGGCYGDEALDVGLGLRPDLTGRGNGRAFVRACLDHAMERFMPRTIRLTVAAFNERAINVYEQAGFIGIERCSSPVRGVDTAFVVMRRPMEPAERELDALSR